jgi:arsenate reductase-like glutaredoxin family protein
LKHGGRDYHNPDCGTSRNVLAVIEAAGYTPTVIEYLKTGWTKPQLQSLLAAAGLTPRAALRETKSPLRSLAFSTRKYPTKFGSRLWSSIRSW